MNDTIDVLVLFSCVFGVMGVAGVVFCHRVVDERLNNFDNSLHGPQNLSSH